MNITDIDDKIIKKAIQVCLILSVKKKISEKHKLTSFWFLFKNKQKLHKGIFPNRFFACMSQFAKKKNAKTNKPHFF